MSVDLPRPVCPVVRVRCMHDAWLIGLLTNADDIELETPLHRLPLNLLGDAVETDIAVRKDGLRLVLVVCGSHCG